jgi:hypothetical protein
MFQNYYKAIFVFKALSQNFIAGTAKKMSFRSANFYSEGTQLLILNKYTCIEYINTYFEGRRPTK